MRVGAFGSARTSGGDGTVGSRSHVAVSPGATCVPPAIPYRSDRNNWGGARRMRGRLTTRDLFAAIHDRCRRCRCRRRRCGAHSHSRSRSRANRGLSLGASMPRSEQRRGWRRSSRRGKDRRRWWCSVGARVRRSGVRSMRRRSGRWRCTPARWGRWWRSRHSSKSRLLMDRRFRIGFVL